MKIIADKNIPFLKGIAESYGEVTYLPGADFTKESIEDADTLIVRTVTHFGKENLENSKVKLICSATIGYDHIDTKYCEENGIEWHNAPGCNSGSVQQYIASALITIARKKKISLQGKTIGIVGVGNVGKKVASICELLGMRVLKNDPPRQEAENSDEFTDIETIKREADIITFHTPLIREGKYATYHLANDDFFNNLSQKPIIINSARGGIIDTSAIKAAIQNHKISGAIIDCWESEPHIDLEYMNMADIATPHIAGYSADGKANATRMSLESLTDYWSLPKDPIKKITVPQVENPIIDYSSFGEGNILEDIILKTYNPIEDHERFVKQPEEFSNLRGNYPLRREYIAYTVKNIKNKNDQEILGKIGFRINSL
ncbi:MAG: 4-phosphoerythronate dehydrogenase PdxB [Dysgonomonas sp.]|nr:4-phosphoerythronate dehydrogenase PdxB [Dysgonomonas sp.]